MNILALDLGTKCGMAWNYGPWPGACTEQLATAKEITMFRKTRMDRRLDPRIPKLHGILKQFSPAPHLVVFEDVEFQTYTKQTQLWASLRAAVWLAFWGAAAVECVPVTTLKKFATGSGNADKAMMKRALFTQYPKTKPDLDDNAIDALWILKWAEHNLGRIN